eukprot:PLAT10399.1.p2 GENE.PLAT10399.1~~PLAT10399.1.p2  ORF type:complete len:255 (-),score=103.00 PLAT10399.1:73-807(-)
MADASWAVPPPKVTSLAVDGSDARFPVRRVFCIGRNYSDHVREMGGDPASAPPALFSKYTDSVYAVPAEGGTLLYPPLTEDFHYEGELVVALQKGGRDIAVEDAPACVFGLAVGLDMTRRDRQRELKKAGTPWELAKSFDQAAPVGSLADVTAWTAEDWAALDSASIALTVNGEEKQRSTFDRMIWSVQHIIAYLSSTCELAAGDIIFTGTPAGVGAVAVGDVIAVSADGIPSLEVTVVDDAAE